MKEKLKEELIRKATGMKLPCGDARKLAEDLGVPYSEVGVAADELGIKIMSCQLGCF